MSNASIRRLIVGIGVLLVVLICGVLIFLHFHFRWNVQTIDASKYINVYKDSDGAFRAELDSDRLITEERLKNPTPEEEAQYPEIAVLKSLIVNISQQGDNYTLLVQIPENADKANAILKERSISLTNLKWQLDRADMEKMCREAPAVTPAPQNGMTVIDMSRYIVVRSDGNGGYTASLDTDRLIREKGLPNPADADLDKYPEIKLIRNLTVAMTQQDNVYVFEVQNPQGGDANAILENAGIRLNNLKWQIDGSQMEHVSGATPAPNRRELLIPNYVCTSRADDGSYAAVLDIARLLNDAGVSLTADPETNLDARILRSLSVNVQKTDEGYTFQTGSFLSTVQEDLKNAGFVMRNLSWTWTEAEMEAHLGTASTLPDPVKEEPPKKTVTLEFPAYVRTNRPENGEYEAKLDIYAMLIDAGIEPTADPEKNSGALCLRSLGVSMQKTDEGYKFQTTSTLPTIMDSLKEANIGIRNTQWTWTEEEMKAHEGTPTKLPAPVKDTASATETTAPATPDTGTTPAPETTAPETAAPTGGDAARNPNAINTLYGFDQTEVRKAIRAAKEQKYGSSIESSEVKFNYFAVGDTAAAHGNVFRLVYKITTSGGSIEYLIADVYDLERETGYTAGDVHLSVETDRNTAKSTSDLGNYTVHTLNGGSMPFPENSGKSPFNDEGLVMPKSLNEQVSYDELWDIPASDEMTLLQLLGYARNEMFAQGGHQFGEGTNYLKFFSQYSWYHPDGKVSVDDLASQYPATRKNIESIKFLEKLIKEG